jgi:hypothetical protein
MTHRRAARRDNAESPIVEALRSVGASVTFVSVPGVPDLLVGYQGRTLLLEVKEPLGPKGGNRGRGTGAARLSAGGDGTLSAEQLAWWAEWKGSPPVIVRTPAEALKAIGCEVGP